MAKMPASMVAPDDFLFPKLEGRPFRAISIETEIDGPGPEVARSLYSCGIIGTDHVMQYGSHPGESHPHVAFLKHDGSVTCGEVIFDRIYLDQLAHAKGLRVAMEKMRQLEKKGSIAYNPNCGGHVHVESEEGVGTTFRVEVPYGSEHLPQERVVSGVPQSGRAPRRAALFVEEALRWIPDAPSEPPPALVAEGLVMRGAAQDRDVVD